MLGWHLFISTKSVWKIYSCFFGWANNMPNHVLIHSFHDKTKARIALPPRQVLRKFKKRHEFLISVVISITQCSCLILIWIHKCSFTHLHLKGTFIMWQSHLKMSWRKKFQKALFLFRMINSFTSILTKVTIPEKESKSWV